MTNAKLRGLLYIFEEEFTLTHCNQKFKPFDIWFLYDNKGFYERSLALGKCPKCNKPVAELKEKRKADDRIFTQLFVGQAKVEKITSLNKTCVNYSSQDIKVKRCKMTMPRSIRYGENKIVKKGDKKYFRQNAVSWINGKKECIKDILLK